MSEPGTSATSVEGVEVDVDAVATAVRTSPGVDDLDAGRLVHLGTYLPGRMVPGVRVDEATVTVQVRTRWNVPMPEVAAQIRARVAPLVGGRRIDVVVADLTDPPSDSPDSPDSPARPAAPDVPALPAAAATTPPPSSTTTGVTQT